MTLLCAAAELSVGAQSPASARTRLEIGVMGGLSLALKGVPIVLPNRKARALIAYLALAPSASYSRERLAGLFWPDSGDARARSSLRTTLHELRKALHAHGCRALRDGQEEVSVARDLIEVDFENVLTAIEAGSLPDNLLSGSHAAPLLLAGYEDLSEDFRLWLEQLRADAQGRLARALERGYNDPALAPRQRRRMAEVAFSLDRIDEAACRALMHLAAEGGEIGVALRAYASLYDALGVELDMEPSDATQALVAAIKSGLLGVAPPLRPSVATETMLPPAPAGPASQTGIIVLPFDATGPVDTREAVVYFAEGLEEGIVHVLSGIGDLFVIARGTARSFINRQVDPRQIGRDLGVDYTLSGRISTHLGGLRVFTELAECTTGRVVRTGCYDTPAQGLFVLQDQLADELVTIIAPAVKAHELVRARRKPPKEMAAYDLMLQGVELQNRLDNESYSAAGDLLYEAIVRDPSFAPTYEHAAAWHEFRINQGWSPDPVEDAARAGWCASKALELDKNNAVALAIQGQVLCSHSNYSAARQYLDRAIAVGPSSVLAWSLSSATHSWMGNGELGVEHANRALRLSPFDPFVSFTEHMLSQAHYVNGDLAVAITLGRRVAQRNPRLTSNLRVLTAALMATGMVQAARDVAATMLIHEPQFSLSTFARRTPLCDSIRGKYVGHLRGAGLPE
jgi:DNA-binding SARP family transcriptional activator/TolB-like protein